MRARLQHRGHGRDAVELAIRALQPWISRHGRVRERGKLSQSARPSETIERVELLAEDCDVEVSDCDWSIHSAARRASISHMLSISKAVA